MSDEYSNLHMYIYEYVPEGLYLMYNSRLFYTCIEAYSFSLSIQSNIYYSFFPSVEVV